MYVYSFGLKYEFINMFLYLFLVIVCKFNCQLFMLFWLVFYYYGLFWLFVYGVVRYILVFGCFVEVV